LFGIYNFMNVLCVDVFFFVFLCLFLHNYGNTCFFLLYKPKIIFSITNDLYFHWPLATGHCADKSACHSFLCNWTSRNSVSFWMW